MRSLFAALVAVTLQIAYLGTLCSEFEQQENEQVTLLNAPGQDSLLGAGVASHALCAGISSMSTMDTCRSLRAVGALGC